MVGRICCSIGRTPCFIITLGGVCACTIVEIVINKLAKLVSERKRQMLFAKRTFFKVESCICIVFDKILVCFLVKIGVGSLYYIDNIAFIVSVALLVLAVIAAKRDDIMMI